jgi:hypothetical protein
MGGRFTGVVVMPTSLPPRQTSRPEEFEVRFFITQLAAVFLVIVLGVALLDRMALSFAPDVAQPSSASVDATTTIVFPP